MKIHNPFPIIPGLTKGSSAGSPKGAAEPFGALLKQRCQETGASQPAGGGGGGTVAPPELDLAGSVLDCLERIAAQLGGGASPRELAASHEQLARQVAQLRQAAEGLGGEAGQLKDLLSETAALGYVQLWRFEQGDLF
jgi:hypothetical protein